MFKKLQILLATFILLLFAVTAGAAIKLIYPAPKSWVKRSDYLILKLNNPEITGVKISVNGLVSDLLFIGTPEYRKAFQDMMILQPVWDPGKNDLIIEGYAADKKVETFSTDIYFGSKSSLSGDLGGYRANVIHIEEVEKICVPCHVMNPSVSQVDSGLDTKNPCYLCHKKIMNMSFVHGPAGTFSCSYCHSFNGTPKYATPRRDSTLCGECHADKTAEFKKKKFRHGPVDVGMCEICHDSHGSANVSQLLQPINELCFSCHEKVRTEVHVVKLQEGGHPLSGVPDISKPGSGRDLSCISCHNPHGGDARYYFVTNSDNRMQLCQACHNK
jgi:predicted CXXCH cytochrome family protein